MIGYQAAHKRLQAALGKASTRTCPCGRKAIDWALTTAGPVIIDPDGRTYSTDVADYTALCRACHMDLDLGRDTCRRGHPLIGANLVASSPKRMCKTCHEEHHKIVRRAAKTLGMTTREFRAQYGARRAVAEELLAAKEGRWSA